MGAALIAFSVLIQVLYVLGLALLVIGCGVCIYCIIQHFSQKKTEKESLNEILQIPEPKPVFQHAKAPRTNAPPEEIRIYEALKRFLPFYDTYLAAVEKRNWMRSRREAQIKLEMKIDFSDEQFCEQEKIVELEEKRCREKALPSPDAFYPERPKNIFENFSKNLVPPKDSLISHFFTGIPIYTIRESHTEFVFFTPWYLLFFDQKNCLLTIEDYESLCFKTETSVVKKTGNFKTDDEIAYKTWEHERKDGGPDLRYRENSCTTYLYRGKISFSCKAHKWSQDFPNKSSMEFFEKSLKMFLESKPLPVLKNKSEKTNTLEKAKLSEKTANVKDQAAEPLAKQEDNFFLKHEIAQDVIDKRLSSTPLFQPTRRVYTAQELAEEYRNLLAPGVIICHRILGEGILTRIEESKGYLYVRFGSEEKKFLYPKSIQQGYFTMIQSNKNSEFS